MRTMNKELEVGRVEAEGRAAVATIDKDAASSTGAFFNAINGTTALGLAMATLSGAAGGCRSVNAGRNWVCTGAAFNWGAGGGTTTGSVFMTTHSSTWVSENPSVMGHEQNHTDQYSAWGLAMIPAYGVASAYSMASTGSYGCGNGFEIGAGLAAGGYTC